MATEEIQISQLELAQEVQGDMVFAVDTATDTKSLSVNQLKNHISQPLQANINAVDTSALHKYNISNCLTEIPQDIKLELNNGTLTLKAGSKVYVPNGFESDGTTPRFDVYTTTTDYTADTKAYSGIYFIGVDRSTGLIVCVSTIQNCISGTNAPSSPTALQGWYDTTNNIIKRYSSGSEQTSFRCSFPLCYVTSDGTNITSINQVFNGFGYIGSTVFALPGVKGLIPNGRNANGTLKNIEFETIQVNIHTQAGKQDYAHIYLASNFIFPSNARNYNNEENYNYNINSGNIENNICEVGSLTRTSTSPYAITSFNPKTAFHAVDYNDFEKAMLKEDWVKVSTLPASPDSSKFYYIPEN